MLSARCNQSQAFGLSHTKGTPIRGRGICSNTDNRLNRRWLLTRTAMTAGDLSAVTFDILHAANASDKVIFVQIG